MCGSSRPPTAGCPARPTPGRRAGRLEACPNAKVGRGDPRNLSQPFLPGSVVGECSMDLAVTNCKLLRYMLGNCTLVMARGEGNQRGGYGLATNLLSSWDFPSGSASKVIPGSWKICGLRARQEAGITVAPVICKDAQKKSSGEHELPYNVWTVCLLCDESAQT